MLPIFYSLYLLCFGLARFFLMICNFFLALHKVWGNVFSTAMLKVPVVLENMLMTLNIMLNSVNPKGCTASPYQIYYCVVVIFNDLPVALD